MKSTALRSDSTYLTLAEAQSTFQYAYNTQAIPKSDQCTLLARGDACKQMSPGARQIDNVNSMLPRHTRINQTKDDTWRGRDILSTELYGTAPLLARGDGPRKFPDVESRLRVGAHTAQRERSAIMEQSFIPLSRHFNWVENAVEDCQRGGILTRVGPVCAPVAITTGPSGGDVCAWNVHPSSSGSGMMPVSMDRAGR